MHRIVYVCVRVCVRGCVCACVGVTVKFKMEGKLFRRYMKNADGLNITEYLFVDILMGHYFLLQGQVQREEYQSVSSDFGLI